MLKEKLKGFIAGVVVTSMLIGVVSAFAEDMQKTIDIIYRNIKIYVDGAEYVAKDANGEIVEPFIYNGTTYLPVRGVANAFGKDVVWDGATASVYLGYVPNKPAINIEGWNKPYLEVGNPLYFSAYEKENNNYIQFGFSRSNIDDSSYPVNYGENYVKYDLKGLCKKVNGKIISEYTEQVGHQLIISCFDEDENLLYQSPIVTESTEDIEFSFATDSKKTLKILATWKGPAPANTNYFSIENLTLSTTDY